MNQDDKNLVAEDREDMLDELELKYYFAKTDEERNEIWNQIFVLRRGQRKAA